MLIIPMYQLIHTPKLLLSFSNNVYTLQLKIMENLSLDSEHEQKVPDMQEMVQILQRQKKTNSNDDDSNSDKQDKSSNSDLSSPKVTSTPVLSPAYEVEINKSFERVYISPNITPENASPVPMQLVEKSVEKKGDINLSAQHQVKQFQYHVFLKQTMILKVFS